MLRVKINSWQWKFSIYSSIYRPTCTLKLFLNCASKCTAAIVFSIAHISYRNPCSGVINESFELYQSSYLDFCAITSLLCIFHGHTTLNLCISKVKWIHSHFLIHKGISYITFLYIFWNSHLLPPFSVIVLSCLQPIQALTDHVCRHDCLHWLTLISSTSL